MDLASVLSISSPDGRFAALRDMVAKASSRVREPAVA